MNEIRISRPLSDLVAGLAYFVLASIAIVLTRLNGGVALLWVANAVTLVMLCRRQLRDWPVTLAAAAAAGTAASVLFGAVPAAGPAFAVANVGEAALAAVILRRFGVYRDPFRTTGSVLLFTLGAAVLAPAVGGVAGATVGAVVFHKPWLATWVDWFIGHGLGMLIATPLTLLLASGRLAFWCRSLTRASAARAALFLGLVAAVTVGVFAKASFPLLFLTTLPVLIATFQLRQIGAALSMTLIAIIGGAITLHGVGPVKLMGGSHVVELQFFQFYLAATFLMCLPVAAALEQREHLLAALRESETRYRLLADSVTDVIVEAGVDGVIRYASPAIRALAGFDPATLVGRDATELVHSDDRKFAREAHRSAIAAPGSAAITEYRLIKADGSTGWFETRANAVTNAAGDIAAVISVLRDVGDRKALETLLREAADTDPLTGLANRRAFLRHLEPAIASAARGRTASLALLDLDFFKRVNDRHGHAAGDTALMLIADICRQHVRAEDIVARIGGEEFALLLSGASEAEAITVCDRLREKIARCAIPVGPGRTVHISASIGVAELTAGRDGGKTLSHADAALYQAKAAGRNRTQAAA